MPYNLTGSSPTYNSTGKFGASLNGGSAMTANPFPTNGTFTISAWVKISSTQHGATLRVAAGAVYSLWFGVDASGNATGRFGVSPEVTLTSTTNIVDNNWHELRIAADNSSIYFFVDGVMVFTVNGNAATNGMSYANALEFRTFSSGAFVWPGEIDEAALYNTCTHTAAYTPATAATSNSATGLRALWHFNNDLTDSNGAAAATLPGAPTIGTATAAPTGGSVAFTAGTAGTNATTSYIATASTGETATGATSPITFSDGSLSAGVARTIHVQAISSDGTGAASAESNSITPTSVAATTTTLTGPSTGIASTASSNFIVAANGTITGAVRVTPSDAGAGGTFVPTFIDISAGAANGTFTYIASSSGAKTISTTNNGALTNPASITYTASAGANNALTGATANVLFSPYTWNIGTGSAKTINSGAYFKTIFGGTSCTLNFDMTGIASPVPQISFRVDRFGPWVTVPIAASVVVTIPADVADYAAKGGHLLEVLVKSTSETQLRWGTQTTAVKLTGIILDNGKTISAPPALPLKAIFYGDSITEGVRTVNMTATNDTDRNDAGQCWSLEAGRILGAEVGNVGFGATGFNQAGSGGVPALTASYNFLYSGVARSFAAQPDFIVLMQGTNDSGDVTTNATAVLNGLLAATTTSKIIVLRPFNGSAHGAQLQAAIADSTAPARCFYIDTTGFFNTTNSSDALHPYGNENITHIAPLVAAAIRTVLASVSSAAHTPITFTPRCTLKAVADGAAAANVGMHAFVYDLITGELVGVKTGLTSSSAGLPPPFTVAFGVAGGAGYDVKFVDDANNLRRSLERIIPT